MCLGQVNNAGEETVSHALWAGGKKQKEVDSPFVAKDEDLPFVPKLGGGSAAASSNGDSSTKPKEKVKVH